MSERAGTSGGGFWEDADDDQSLRRYRALVDLVDDGIYQLDAEGRFVAVNDAIVEITGYSREELLERHVSHVFEGPDVARIERDLRGRDTLGGETAEADAFDIEIETADGEERPCELRVIPLVEDGRFRGTIGTVSVNGDRPERRESSNSMRKHCESITAVLDEADVGVFVLDEEFEVGWINDAAERYFGLDRESVVGRDKRELIEGTIRDRLSDAETFAETVLSTYEDNSYAERFQCRITSGADREERWLEHRSKPISSGRYAGGRVELYYDITEQRRRAAQMERLHEGVREWVEATSREEVAELASRHLADVSNLEINAVFLHDETAEELRPAAESDRAKTLFDELPAFAEGEGVVWRAFETGQPEIYDGVTGGPNVLDPDTPIRSGIVLPIGDHGVVVVGSEKRAAFDESDLSLAKIVASSLEATYNRIRHERRLERERNQTEKLLRTAPVAISVEEADGETLLANQRTQDVFELSDLGLLRDPNENDGWEVFDADGNPLAFEDRPAARVAETGEPVFDEEMLIERSPTDRRWVLISAAPVFDSEGDLDRIITAGNDITDLKERERRLEQRADELATELNEIFGRVTDAFYALDTDWTFTHVNEQAEELIDFDDEGLVGENIWDVFEWAADSKLREEYERAMTTQTATSFELYYPEPLESWYEINAYPSETGLSVYFRDITERKAYEQQLEQYRALTEAANDLIVTIDEESTIQSANPAVEDVFGYTPGEVVGEPLTTLMPDGMAERHREALGRYLETGERTLDWSYVELPGARADGEEIPLAVSFNEIRHEGERYFTGIVRDITERKERERALRKERNLVERIVEASPVGIVTVDEDGTYEILNERATEILGYSYESIEDPADRAERLDPVTPDGEPLDEEYRPHRRILEGGETFHEVEIGIRQADGERRWLSVSGAHLADEDDGIAGGVVALADVTERKRYEHKLEESNERLERFAYAASHDLQEPLRMVSSYLQLIERRYGDELDEDGREFLEFAVDGAERMREMIEGLLEYSRIETQGEPFEPVDLDTVLENVLDDLRLRVEESNAEIAAEPLPTVEGDGGQLRQVFQNLLDNAIEYSGDAPPQIRVSAEREGPKWRITVEDEGIGIDPGDHERVFEVFQRLHTSDEHAGTGIGLALCRRIVERHGGEIRIDSEPGEGTTFSFMLPAVDGSKNPSPDDHE